MNYLDIIILIILGVFTIKGMKRGLIQETFGLISLLIAFSLAIKYMDVGARVILLNINISNSVAPLLAFGIIFLGIFLIFKWLAKALHKILDLFLLGWLDHIGGALFGFFKVGLLVSLILIFLSMIPFTGMLLRQKEDSLLFTPAKKFAPEIFNIITYFLPEAKTFYNEVIESFSDDSWFDLKGLKNSEKLMDVIGEE